MTDATSTTGFTAGVFDLLHVGHLNLLEESARRCDRLCVGVISDELAWVLKRVRTFVPLEERMRLVGALACVDEVVAIRDERLLSKVEAFYEWGFDVAFTGDDHQGDPYWEQEGRALERLGARIEYLPYTRGTSSTQLRMALLAVADEDIPAPRADGNDKEREA